MREYLSSGRRGDVMSEAFELDEASGVRSGIVSAGEPIGPEVFGNRVRPSTMWPMSVSTTEPWSGN
jgi:hypothetical protein